MGSHTRVTGGFAITPPLKEPTMPEPATYDPWHKAFTQITALLHNPDDAGIDAARAVFVEFADASSPDELRHLVRALNDAAAPAHDAIHVGLGVRVFGNPMQQGWAWQCGACHARWQADAGAPAVGVGYKTRVGARRATEGHAAEHPGIKIKEV